MESTDLGFKIRYLKPRESLGKFLFNLGFPTSDWHTFVNDEQKEYWYSMADKIIAFKSKGGF